ncbi:GDP-L-fucose synthase [Gammaproteobacteria bacterium]|jgi:GDP-L-fucose synthase|nr:GDP-L-fucose synthase [Gammaproteobacteria bacterium]
MTTKVLIAGYKGMVGSAIVRQLANDSEIELITPSRQELDFTDTNAVKFFMAKEKPDQIYLAAAKVGGIYANQTYPADFIADNLAIQSNIIKSAYDVGVHKLLFLGSSCIYPRLAKQPIKEDSLLTGLLESTNEPYAIAKIAGIKMCESFNRQYGVDYRCVMPTNLYGENDNFHPENSHVIPAMMRRFHEAKQSNAETVEVWGSGNPMREFLHVDDMAKACLYVMKMRHKDFINSRPDPFCSHINVGTGKDVTIASLARVMAKVIGFNGQIVFNTSKPDGTPRKLMDVSLLSSMGWTYKTDLEEGLEMTYNWFLSNIVNIRK